MLRIKFYLGNQLTEGIKDWLDNYEIQSIYLYKIHDNI